MALGDVQASRCQATLTHLTKLFCTLGCRIVMHVAIRKPAGSP